MESQKDSKSGYSKLSMRKYIAKCFMNEARLNYVVERWAIAKEMIQEAKLCYDNESLEKDTGLKNPKLSSEETAMKSDISNLLNKILIKI